MSLRRVLLIRLGALGDTILASSAAGLLRRHQPDVEIDLLVSSGLERLCVMVPEVSEAYGVPLRKLPPAWNPGLRRTLLRLNRKGYDLAYLMETSPRFLPLLRSIRADEHLALGQGAERDEPAEGVPAALRYQRLLWAEGIAPDQVCYPRLAPKEEAVQGASRLLADLGLDPRRPLVGLHPGNSFRGRKKWRRWRQRADIRSWPETRWVELVRGLVRLCPEAQLVLFGSAQDRPVNGRVLKGVGRELPGCAIASSAGRTENLALAAALLSRFSLFVATDTGPLHMAAALGVPLVGLYGPTRYRETGPFTDRAAAVTVRKSLPCQPCYGRAEQKICRLNRCMLEIRADEVLEKIVETRVLEPR
ncbi:MAG: glycosyltransferase family 9 protein [bacterium]